MVQKLNLSLYKKQHSEYRSSFNEIPFHSTVTLDQRIKLYKDINYHFTQHRGCLAKVQRVKCLDIPG